MSISEQIDELQKHAAEVKDSYGQATHESSTERKARIDKTRAGIEARHSAVPDEAGKAADRKHSQWQAMKADTAAKMRDLHNRVASQRDEHDLKAAEQGADDAEDETAYVLDFAIWVVDQAKLAVLDAVDARSWADARAAASSQSKA